MNRKKRQKDERSWLVKDDMRMIPATVIMLAAAILAVVLFRNEGSESSAVFLALTASWSIFALLTVVMIWLAYHSLSREELRPAIVHRPRQRWLEVLFGLSGPTDWVVLASLMALIVTLMSLVQPHGTLWTRAAAFMCAVSSWVLVVFVQALAYARLSLIGTSTGVIPEGGETADARLEFRQRDEPVFADYLTMAFAIQAAFNHPAVEVEGRDARSLVVQHQVVGFVFNTIIIAVLVALLLATVSS